MRYFLDCEYDGFGGPLLSLALVPDDDGEEFYAVIEHDRPLTDWVERHVAPFFGHVPAMLKRDPQPPTEVARDLSAWLAGLSEVEVVADWPEDLSLFCRLLVTGNGEVVDMPALTLRWLRTPGFSTARNSAVPHNALHDARALRDHVVSHLD